MASKSKTPTGTARRAAGTSRARNARTVAADPAKIAAEIAEARSLADGAPNKPRLALEAAIAQAIAADTLAVIPAARANGAARWAALADAGEGIGYVILPVEEFDRGGNAAAAGAWVSAGGHKTIAAYVTRKVAPHHAGTYAWWNKVTTAPVPAGALPTLKHGGYIAFLR